MAACAGGSELLQWVPAAALLCLAGCSPRQVSDSGFGAYEVSLAAWDDQVALAWYDTRDGNAEVYVQMLGADGRDAGAELRLTTTDAESYEADIAPLTDAFAIAWYEKAADGALEAYLGVWSHEGVLEWSVPVAAGVGNTRNPVVRSFGGVLFCAWIEADAEDYEFVWGGWWELDGRPREPPVRLGAASETTWNLNAAIGSAGEAWVAFDAEAGTRVEELFLAKLADGDATVTRVTSDDGRRSMYPDLALEGALGALTWFDERDGNREVYLSVAPIAELLLAAEDRAQRVTLTAGQSIGAYVAWNRGRVGLAWSDNSSGNYEVFFRAFDAAGNAQGSTRQLSHTPTNSMIPAIEPWRSGFALAWDEVTLIPGGPRNDSTRAEVVFTTVR